MGRMQRVKGQVFERLIAQAFRQIFPEAKRGIGQARASTEVPDVDIPGFWPECKHGALPNPRAALEQAIEAGKKSGRLPFAIVKDNRSREPFVVLRFCDFLPMLRWYAHSIDEPVAACCDLDLPTWARLIGNHLLLNTPKEDRMQAQIDRLEREVARLSGNE